MGTKIRAYAIATGIVDPIPADHAFVTAGDNHEYRWGCGGRSDPNEEGAREIVNGDGSLKMAKCIAGGDGTAGIRWGVNGMCHQSANRILFACAGHPQVVGALGHAGSFGIYTPYGLDIPQWEVRKRKCQLGSIFSPSSSDLLGMARDASDELWNACAFAVQARDESASESMISSLRPPHSTMQQERLALMERQLAGTLTDEQYRSEFQAILERTFERFADTLGHQRYLSIYELEPRGMARFLAIPPQA